MPRQPLDKAAWGPGPWQDEPDDLTWIDEATGLPCVMLRHPEWGQWNGYVGVPPGHALFGHDYNDHIALKPEYLEGSTDGRCIIQTFSYVMGGGTERGTVPVGMVLDVHSGVNFADSEAPDGSGSRYWWFGFDCGHAFDVMPGFERRLREIPALAALPHDYEPRKRYRDLEYVKREVTSLAKQLKALEAVEVAPPLTIPQSES